MMQSAMEDVAQLIGGCLGPHVQADLRFGRGWIRDEIVEQLFGFSIGPIGRGQGAIGDQHTRRAKCEDAQRRGRLIRTLTDRKGADLLLNLGDDLGQSQDLTSCPGRFKRG